MIVVETFLRELFSQLPPMVDSNGKTFPVKFHWGGRNDLNLYMQKESGNKTPLIWLEQSKSRVKSTELTRNLVLIIAKNSTHKDSRNPVVWDTEFVEVLDPILENVIQCFKQSGITTILNQEYTVYREANYSYDSSESETKTTDHWNVIELTIDVLFNDNSICIQTINF